MFGAKALKNFLKDAIEKVSFLPSKMPAKPRVFHRSLFSPLVPEFSIHLDKKRCLGNARQTALPIFRYFSYNNWISSHTNQHEPEAHPPPAALGTRTGIEPPFGGSDVPETRRKNSPHCVRLERGETRLGALDPGAGGLRTSFAPGQGSGTRVHRSRFGILARAGRSPHQTVPVAVHQRTSVRRGRKRSMDLDRPGDAGGAAPA